MKFDTSKIKEVKQGRPEKVSEEEVLEAMLSGLFKNQSAIARYFEVTPMTVSYKVKSLREKGLLPEKEEI